MGSILQIVVLVCVLSALVFVFLSYQSVRIYNLVLLVFVLLATLPLCWMTARTLKTHESWRSMAKAREADLEAVEKKNRELAEGVEAQGQQASDNIRALKLQLHQIAIDRGGVWRDVTPEKIKSDTGAITISVDNPDPPGMDEKLVVYIFDPSQYLGEFQVTKAGKTKSVDLVPNIPLSPNQLKRLATSRGPWTVYQTSPLDDPRIFAALNPNDLQNLLGKISPDVVAEWSQANRPHRNYQMIFHQFSHRTSMTLDEIAKINDKITRLKDSNVRVLEDIKYRETEKGDLQTDLKDFQRERTAIVAYLQKLQDQLTAVRKERLAIYMATKQAAAELTELQIKAAEQINLRTSTDQASLEPQAVRP
jgi:hypothetical protein